MSNDRPRVKLQPGGDKRAMLGHPWIFSNELVMDAGAKALEPGTVATVTRADGRPLGSAFFNPHSLIAARLLTRDADRTIDETFLHRRLERAFKLRERLIGGLPRLTPPQLERWDDQCREQARQQIDGHPKGDTMRDNRRALCVSVRPR